MPLFQNTEKFTNAVSLMNTFDSPQQFFKLLNHILSKYKNGEFEGFSQVEKERLLELFTSIKNDKQLILLIDACSYVFEQALYNSLNPEKLYQELIDSQTGILDTHAQAFQEAWKKQGREYLNQARERHSLGGPVTLENFDWRLQMQLSQADMTKIKTPCALFEFTTLDASQKNNETNKPKEEKLLVEFTRDELYL
ncbi:hypothetical protein ABK040_004918 [Willaertia magna]